LVLFDLHDKKKLFLVGFAVDEAKLQLDEIIETSDMCCVQQSRIHTRAYNVSLYYFWVELGQR